MVHEPSGIMPDERVVTIGQSTQVAQHRGLGAVRRKYRVAEERRSASQRVGQWISDVQPLDIGEAEPEAEGAPDGDDVPCVE